MIRIKEFKEPQHNLKSEKFVNPKKLILPLCQHTGRPSTPCVKIKDEVEEGQLLAKEDGFISAQLHSPSKGKILNISNFNHPVLQKGNAIVVLCSPEKKSYSLRKHIDDLGNDEIVDIIKNNGIVGMGGAGFPSHVKLQPPKKIDTLLINGCECEPFLSTDHRLMIENLKEIFIGIEIIAKLIKPKRIVFALEENKTEEKKQINFYINTRKFKLPKTELIILKTAYPQGGEKQLIYAVTKQKVPGGKLPLDIGCLVHNVATCFAIYEAVYLNKPLIERLVSFCGDSLVKPKNVWVKIGTTLQELFDQKILEFINEPKKIISGGPMMGITLTNLEYPILKGNGGFLFLRNHVTEIKESACIRCARCIDVCPMNLLPQEYVKRVKNEEYNDLVDLNIKDCIECGCCAYICPAQLPIVHYIKTGKVYVPKN